MVPYTFNHSTRESEADLLLWRPHRSTELVPVEPRLYKNKNKNKNKNKREQKNPVSKNKKQAK